MEKCFSNDMTFGNDFKHLSITTRKAVHLFSITLHALAT